jgi:predicted RNase H-like HicB family nuclease
MNKKVINVEAFWDDKARVWVASSDDVPGLITEADTTELLLEKLKILIPELLEANGMLPENEHIDIPLNLMSRREDHIKMRAH